MAIVSCPLGFSVRVIVLLFGCDVCSCYDDMISATTMYVNALGLLAVGGSLGWEQTHDPDD